MSTYETIHGNFESLTQIKGKLAKRELLKDMLQDELMVKVVQYALDADKTYHMKGVPKIETVLSNPLIVPFDSVFTLLDNLNAKGSAGRLDKETAATMAATDKFLYGILDRILRKDLRCGVSAKTINQIVPNLIFDVPYQRCSSESKLSKINYLAIVQTKEDGQFAYGFSEPHPRTGKHFLSRNGSGYDLFDQISKDVPEGKVLVGEMRILDDTLGKFLDRKTSNGLMDKFIEGTGDAELATKVRFVVWDMLTEEEFFAQKSDQPYKDRWGDLRLGWKLLDTRKLSWYPVKSEIVNNEDEARAFYRRMRLEGEEGAILKDVSATWGYNTSPKMVKLKNVAEAEFEIVDAYYGEKGKKYEHILGGLTVKTSDGLLVTNMGSGFSDAERELGVGWWKAQKGKIITGKFTEVLEDKTERTTKALGNPRFVETRFNEKTVADTLTYVEEQCK